VTHAGLSRSALLETHQITKVNLQTQDQTTLVAQFYPVNGAQKIVLIAPATAVPQGFYRRFALAMNARGYSALSLDYRGIGASRPTRLKGFAAGYRHWGEQDLSAAFNFAHGHGDVYLAGHSFAGHGVGMLPRAGELKAAWICGSGAGYSGYMPVLERVKVELLWHLLAPASALWKGYAPMSWFGIGEDIPLGIYQDWKRWCAMPKYFFSDPALENTEFIARFNRLTIPMAFVNASDDKWALPPSRDAFIEGYKSAKLSRVDIRAQDFGVREIGHMGYFRAPMAALWQQAADFFDQY
jgi:predicted alpha/beta hydrolase